MEQVVLTEDDIPAEVAVFRRGRRGMGWSQAALAETVLVSLETLRRWEDGELPIPPKVIAWVGLYARSCPTDNTSPVLEAFTQ
jgi:ribosome-binding protein aMBF1 (putative translation factor)